MDRLEDRLRPLAHEFAGPRPRTASAGGTMRVRQPRLGPRRPAFALAGIASTAFATAGTILLAGTGSTGLPILQTETSDASALAGVPALRRAQVDLRRAHGFSTAGGTGYVLASEDGRRLCLSLPDPTADGSAGATCAPKAAVERRGLSLEATGDRSVDPTARNVVAVLLPRGARDVRLRTARGTMAPRLQAGVFTAALTAPVILLFTVSGRQTRQRFLGPFDGGLIECHGRVARAKDITLPNGRLPACTD